MSKILENVSNIFSLISAKVDKEDVQDHGKYLWEPFKRIKHISLFLLVYFYLLMLLMYFSWKVVEVKHIKVCGKVKKDNNMVLFFIIVMQPFMDDPNT